MSHPFTGKRRSILIYSIVWLFIAAVQGVIYWYFQKFSLSVVIVDPLISNILFGILGLLAWYPTRYIPFQKNTPVYSLSAHVVAGLLVLFTWLMLSVGILNWLFT